MYSQASVCGQHVPIIFTAASIRQISGSPAGSLARTQRRNSSLSNTLTADDSLSAASTARSGAWEARFRERSIVPASFALSLSTPSQSSAGRQCFLTYYRSARRPPFGPASWSPPACRSRVEGRLPAGADGWHLFPPLVRCSSGRAEGETAELFRVLSYASFFDTIAILDQRYG